MKDAYYFSHDSNAKDDPKCVLLIEQLGLEGYGIYWVIIETLREQNGYRYPLALLPALSRRYNSTHEKFKAVVFSYGLFEIENNEFFSLTLNRRMELFDYSRELQREKALKRWDKYRSISMELPEQSQAMPLKGSKVKESKVKEIKEKERKNSPFIPPTLEELNQYLKENNYDIDSEQFISFYESKNWFVGKNKMVSWRAAVRTWVFRNKKERVETSEERIIRLKKLREAEKQKGFGDNNGN